MQGTDTPNASVFVSLVLPLSKRQRLRLSLRIDERAPPGPPPNLYLILSIQRDATLCARCIPKWHPADENPPFTFLFFSFLLLLKLFFFFIVRCFPFSCVFWVLSCAVLVWMGKRRRGCVAVAVAVEGDWDWDWDWEGISFLYAYDFTSISPPSCSEIMALRREKMV
jgi:hypothetical protein